MTDSSPAPSTRKATSFSAEEIQLLDEIFRLMLAGGERTVIPSHYVRHRAFKSVAGKISRMRVKGGQNDSL